MFPSLAQCKTNFQLVSISTLFIQHYLLLQGKAILTPQINLSHFQEPTNSGFVSMSEI